MLFTLYSKSFQIVEDSARMLRYLLVTLGPQSGLWPVPGKLDPTLNPLKEVNFNVVKEDFEYLTKFALRSDLRFIGKTISGFLSEKSLRPISISNEIKRLVQELSRLSLPFPWSNKIFSTQSLFVQRVWVTLTLLLVYLFSFPVLINQLIDKLKLFISIELVKKYKKEFGTWAFSLIYIGDRSSPYFWQRVLSSDKVD